MWKIVWLCISTAAHTCATPIQETKHGYPDLQSCAAWEESYYAGIMDKPAKERGRMAVCVYYGQPDVCKCILE